MEETVAELELSRRKLAALRNPKDIGAVAPSRLKTEAGDRGSMEIGPGNIVETDGGLVEAKVRRLPSCACTHS